MYIDPLVWLLLTIGLMIALVAFLVRSHYPRRRPRRKAPSKEVHAEKEGEKKAEGFNKLSSLLLETVKNKFLSLGKIERAALFPGVQPTKAATFSGGRALPWGEKSGVTTTDVFQVEEKDWSIRLGSWGYSSTLFSGYDLKVEFYEEGHDHEPIRSIRGRVYRNDNERTEVRWERLPGTTEGRILEGDYDPDLPLSSYYLKVYWKSFRWTIDILEWPPPAELSRFEGENPS